MRYAASFFSTSPTRNGHPLAPGGAASAPRWLVAVERAGTIMQVVVQLALTMMSLQWT